MSIYNNKMIRTPKHSHKKILLLIFLIVTVVFAIVGGLLLNVVNIYGKIAEWSLDVPIDTDSFLEPDYGELESVAYYFDDRFPKYHLAWNQVVGTKFKNDSDGFSEMTYTEVREYDFSDNEALWTGTAFAGWTYKYLSAIQENNDTMKEFALDVLVNLTSGLSMLMAVPNGGIGPEYGGILARGYAPPNGNDIWNDIFEEHPKHFNGTGKYSQWRWRGYTSNDEHGGYYLFLALALKYLQDIEPIYNNVSLIVDQLCRNMIDNNWLGIHGTGSTTGVDQKPLLFSGGFWIALLLKMGSICYPDKYEHLYLHYMANDMVYLHASEGGLQETVANYYAYHFAYCVCLGYLLLEDLNSPIGQQYYEGFNSSIWAYTLNHRSPWYNALHLTIAHESGITLARENTIVDDVEDQLTRYTNAHYPDLKYAGPVNVPGEYELFSPVEEFTEKYGIGEGLQDLLGIDADEQFYNKPLTCDYLQADKWIWNDNPWNYEEPWGENLKREYPAISFTVPYWMMRYCGYLQAGGS